MQSIALLCRRVQLRWRFLLLLWSVGWSGTNSLLLPPTELQNCQIAKLKGISSLLALFLQQRQYNWPNKIGCYVTWILVTWSKTRPTRQRPIAHWILYIVDSWGKKSRIRETPNLSTDADRRTNAFFCWKKRNPEQLLVFKALRVGLKMHQSTSQTPPTHWPSTGAIWNNSSFLRLYESFDECTSPLVEHLPCVGVPCMQYGTVCAF